MSEKSLQETYAPKSICYGCGPANASGLHIRSFPQGDEVVAAWQPQPHHQAFAGALNGGIIGTLMDCHCNWTAAFYLMKQKDLDRPPSTVTAEYHIKLLRPTPTDGPVRLVAKIMDIQKDRAVVEGQLLSHDGKLCATCRGVFVAVPPGHPAYHRW